MRKAAGFLVLLGMALALAACGVSAKHWIQLEDLLKKRQYKQAAELVEKRKEKEYGKRNGVLYYMDRGLITHLEGDYPASNQDLQAAEKMADDLYTTSISAQAASFLTNDNTVPYAGEDFERVMLSLFGALNYTYLNQWDEALVEARKIDNKLKYYNDQYGEDNKNVYTEDAFARYLAGILYEAKGEYNDAFIAYKKALAAYGTYLQRYKTPLPTGLAEAYLRCAQWMGPEELETAKKRFPDTPLVPLEQFKQMGQVVFLAYLGQSPVKVDNTLVNGAGVKIVVPKFQPRGTIAQRVVVQVDDQQRLATTGEDIQAIAIQNLEDRMGRVLARSVGRAVVKAAAAAATTAVLGKTAGNVMKIFGMATEQADKRSWRLLPAEIRIARFLVPPGDHQVSAQLFALRDRPLGQVPPQKVTLKAGETRFVTYDYLH